MTDKHIPASKLEALISAMYENNCISMSGCDIIRALIDEAPEADSVCERCKGSGEVEGFIDEGGPNGYYAIVDCCDCKGTGCSPSPDLTKLVGELVEALEKAEKCLVNSCMSHRNKVYPKPVDRVRVANHCNRVITKAREAIK